MTDFTDHAWGSKDNAHRNLLSTLSKHFEKDRKSGVARDGSAACNSWFNLYSWWERGVYSQKYRRALGFDL